MKNVSIILWKIQCEKVMEMFSEKSECFTALWRVEKKFFPEQENISRKKILAVCRDARLYSFLSVSRQSFPRILRLERILLRAYKHPLVKLLQPNHITENLQRGLSRLARSRLRLTTKRSKLRANKNTFSLPSFIVLLYFIRRVHTPRRLLDRWRS